MAYLDLSCFPVVPTGRPLFFGFGEGSFSFAYGDEPCPWVLVRLPSAPRRVGEMGGLLPGGDWAMGIMVGIVEIVGKKNGEPTYCDY